jgi:hypothetical protein
MKAEIKFDYDNGRPMIRIITSSDENTVEQRLLDEFLFHAKMDSLQVVHDTLGMEHWSVNPAGITKQQYDLVVKYNQP